MARESPVWRIEAGARPVAAKEESENGGRLVVISNRAPPHPPARGETSRRLAPVGGLLSAVSPVVEKLGGLWFGWSGAGSERRPDQTPKTSTLGRVQLATLDLSQDDLSLYYLGFANRTLWPLLHSFTERVTIRRDSYGAFRRVNRRFAAALYSLLQPDDVVWVHDFQLFHIGQELRQLGWSGKVGFFLHSPFPPASVFAILPWSRQVLEAMMQYDLVGFQTRQDLRNAIEALHTEIGGISGTIGEGTFVHEDTSLRVGVYPVGIEPARYKAPSGGSGGSLLNTAAGDVPPQRLILGVDRLDYTKGIPLRMKAFEQLLVDRPSLRRKVTYLQVSTPSRSRVPEYIREKEEVDQLVGRINGRFSEADWTPIRYLYRSLDAKELARLYREAEVGLVTPLRDGMNLVAKEFVASQGDDPGVLVLSRFCGAAESLREALIVNPHDVDGTASAIYRALTMSRRERRERWLALMGSVSSFTATAWADAFLADLKRP